MEKTNKEPQEVPKESPTSEKKTEIPKVLNGPKDIQDSENRFVSINKAIEEYNEKHKGEKDFVPAP